VLSLEKKFSKERLEKACERALVYQATSYQFIRNILEKELDRLEPEMLIDPCFIPCHENIRGAAAYQ
jgi:hypothetical protein